MTVTLTSNYREVLNVETVSMIDNLIAENYALDDMLVFIDEHNESDFVAHYEEYVRVGEEIGFEAVDALIQEMGDVSYIEDCDDRYQGAFHSEGDFAKSFYDEMGYSIPDGIVVDWDATWETNLRYDFTACNDGVTYCPIHIFRDN